MAAEHSRKPEPTRREFVGHVWVDHGGVAVVDPMYVQISDDDQERIFDAEPGAKLDCDDDELAKELDHVAVFVTTGLGDGRYPVYADVVVIPGAGPRVARIVIDCLGTEADLHSDFLRDDTVDAVTDLREQTGGSLDVKLPYDETRAVDDEIRRRALGEPENEDDS